MSDTSAINIANFISQLEKFVRQEYGGRLEVEIDNMSYTIYASFEDMRICIGCGMVLSEEVTAVNVYNRGKPNSDVVLFISQCEYCNNALLK